MGCNSSKASTAQEGGRDDAGPEVTEDATQQQQTGAGSGEGAQPTAEGE